jgi:glycosyltransferase involved in cell wall biosynthesis
MRRPRVSILTPSFNQAQWLPQALDSVRNQSYANLEHIVVDGGSVDGTVSILESRDNVTFTSEPDRGQSHALNKAFALSSGDYIGWINSDDAYFDRGAVALAVEALEQNPAAVAAYGHAILVNAVGRVMQVLWAPRWDYRKLRHDNFVIQPTVVLRRSALADGFIDETYEWAMDRELWVRLGRLGEFIRLDRVVAVDRHHAERKSEAGRVHISRDVARLNQQYGVVNQRWNSQCIKARKVWRRLKGLPLAARVGGVDPAVEFPRDGRSRLLFRQLFVPRARMSDS